MSVDELIAALQKLSDEGHGANRVLVERKPLRGDAFDPAEPSVEWMFTQPDNAHMWGDEEMSGAFEAVVL